MGFQNKFLFKARNLKPRRLRHAQSRRAGIGQPLTPPVIGAFEIGTAKQSFMTLPHSGHHSPVLNFCHIRVMVRFCSGAPSIRTTRRFLSSGVG